MSLQTSAAFLRGINVGGKNKLPMKELVPIFEGLGCSSVQTYIQSGNVVFKADTDLLKQLPDLVTAEIERKLGLKVPVIVRSAAALKKVVKANPFADRDSAPQALGFGFLQEKASKAQIARLDPDRSPGDEFHVSAREVYFLFPNGMARTKLTSAYFDKQLDTVLTVRNWKTVQRVIELLKTL